MKYQIAPVYQFRLQTFPHIMTVRVETSAWESEAWHAIIELTGSRQYNWFGQFYRKLSVPVFELMRRAQRAWESDKYNITRPSKLWWTPLVSSQSELAESTEKVPLSVLVHPKLSFSHSFISVFTRLAQQRCIRCRRCSFACMSSDPNKVFLSFCLTGQLFCWSFL